MSSVQALQSLTLVQLCGLASFIIAALCAALLILRKRSSSAGKASVTKLELHANGSVNRDSIDEELSNRPVVRILYGTQTGTAERFSKQLATELKKRYGDSTTIDVKDIENYKAVDRLHKEKLVLFLMATYGDGEPTDNAADFYSWLTTKAEAVDAADETTPFEGVSFAVFGLGNKQYEHFNAVGKRVYKSLEALGAAPLLRRGDGDDDGCIDDDFDKWADELYEALGRSSALVGKLSSTPSLTDQLPVPAYDVQVLTDDAAIAAEPFPAGGTGVGAGSPFLGRITALRELHGPGSDRHCVHVEIDVAGSGIRYEAGDHIGIYAQNTPEVVAEVAALLGHDPSTVIRVSLPPGADGASALSEPFRSPLQLRTALACFADLLSSPHKDALGALAAAAADPAERARLRQLASPGGKAEYAEYITSAHRSLLEVMREFPSARPSLGAFFGSIAPRLQPRFYSISSSPKLYPTSIHVTCAVVRDVMPSGRVHKGVCSTWLQRASVGQLLPVFVRRSHFKLPADPRTPLVMVGPGTGLAPFRGFLQERKGLLSEGAELGPSHLFFGCRYSRHDYLYESELAAAVAGGALGQLHVAFSREAAVKDYVQHHMERHGTTLYTLLAERGGYFYVCGDARHMARDVHKTLIAIVQAGRGCSGTAAEAFVKEITDAGRYQRDVWT